MEKQLVNAAACMHSRHMIVAYHADSHFIIPNWYSPFSRRHFAKNRLWHTHQNHFYAAMEIPLVFLCRLSY